MSTNFNANEPSKGYRPFYAGVPKVAGLPKPTGCVPPDTGMFLRGCDRRPVPSRVSPFPRLAFVILPFPALRGPCGMGSPPRRSRRRTPTRLRPNARK